LDCAAACAAHLLTAFCKVNGRTALHFAAGWGNASITELLLLNGSNVDAVDKAGMSSLHMAARQAHVETIQLLLRHGASPFLSVKRGIFKGRLAIDFVITAKSKEATSLLLLAMQKPQGWPVPEVRKFVETALANFRGLPPSGAPRPRKASISAVPSSPTIGPASRERDWSPLISSIPWKAGMGAFGLSDGFSESERSEHELLKHMDESKQPICIKDGLGHYL
jgi:hypothetical protein